jgi:hypothetical protein
MSVEADALVTQEDATQVIERAREFLGAALLTLPGSR